MLSSIEGRPEMRSLYVPVNRAVRAPVPEIRTDKPVGRAEALLAITEARRTGDTGRPLRVRGPASPGAQATYRSTSQTTAPTSRAPKAVGDDPASCCSVRRASGGHVRT